MLTTLKDSIVFFNSPTDIVEKRIAPGTRIRLGGLVKEGSLVRGDNLAVRFEVTDGAKSIPVVHQGILPDLFREGQGVITEGALDQGGTFKADTILAKHDEKYMPKEVADALKKTGHWKDDPPRRRAPRRAGGRSEHDRRDRTLRPRPCARHCADPGERADARACGTRDPALMGVAGRRRSRSSCSWRSRSRR